MKIRKIVLLSLLAVLVYVYIFQIVSGSKNNIKTITLEETPDVIVLSPASSSDEVIRIVNENSSWFVGDKKYPVDQGVIVSMLDSLKNVKILGTVSSRSDGEKYGLNDGSKITVTAMKNGKAIRKLEIGKLASTSQQSYVRVEGGKDILLASGTLSTLFGKDLAGIRSKSVYSIPSSEVLGLTVQTGDENYTLEKKDGKWTGADVEKITAWVNSICSLNVQSWATDNTVLPKTPDGTVSLLTGNKKIAVSVCKLEEENKYLCSSSEVPYTFYLSSYYGDKYLKKLTDLQ